jgi:hypothetical protein
MYKEVSVLFLRLTENHWAFCSIVEQSIEKRKLSNIYFDRVGVINNLT